MGIFSWRKKDKNAAQEGEMSFFDHLDELRSHLFRCVLAVVLIGVVVFFFSDTLLKLFIDYPVRGDFITYKLLCQWMGGVFCFEKMDVTFQWQGIMEKVMTSFSFSAFGGIFFAFPYIVWELWRFVKPALGDREVRNVRYNVLVISLLFFTGVFFGYFIIVPFALKFSESFQFGGEAENIWRVGGVINFIVMVLLGAGLIFQLPVAMYYLAKLGIMTSAFLRKYRRHATVVILIVAGIITPPDPISIFFLFFPLYFLFEVGVWITVRVEKQKKAKEDAEEAERLKNLAAVSQQSNSPS